MIKGVGVDLVELKRFQDLLEKGKDRFINRYFTADEIAYCDNKMKRHIHYAGKFAAKEALYKALHLTWKKGFQWKHISINNNQDGVPEAIISDTVKVIARKQLINAIHLSISHSNEYAVAFVILTD